MLPQIVPNILDKVGWIIEQIHFLFESNKIWSRNANIEFTFKQTSVV